MSAGIQCDRAIEDSQPDGLLTDDEFAAEYTRTVDDDTRKHESTFELAGAEMTITSHTLAEDAQQLLPTGTVTLLLADIEGSTRLWETQPDRMADALATMDRVLAELVYLTNGVRPVAQGEGDSFVVAFTRRGRLRVGDTAGRPGAHPTPNRRAHR
jgi:class 3 adenylate cyclase